MTAISPPSDIDSASSWSWVTVTVISDFALEICFSSTCIRGAASGRARPAARRGAAPARLVDQRPGQRHPLLLPAGELTWLGVGALAQPDEFQRIPDPWCRSPISDTFLRFRA